MDANHYATGEKKHLPLAVPKAIFPSATSTTTV